MFVAIYRKDRRKQTKYTVAPRVHAINTQTAKHNKLPVLSYTHLWLHSMPGTQSYTGELSTVSVNGWDAFSNAESDMEASLRFCEGDPRTEYRNWVNPNTSRGAW